VLPLLAGCYTLQPVSGTSPVVGSRIAVDVNDAGRLALGGSMGPEIGQIEGTLMQRDNGEYLLGVRSISLLRGGVQVWSGEPVHIKKEYVSTVYQRELSKSRTIALAAAGVGAVALIASQNLLGGGDPQGPKQTPTDTAVTRRSPRTVHFTVFSIGLPGLSSPTRR
jgi:hypothetical protein